MSAFGTRTNSVDLSASKLPLTYEQGAIALPIGGGKATVRDPNDIVAAQPFGRTLRVALAMKGGVSLAVWIGGAVTELDVLRRVRLTGTSDRPGAELLVTWETGTDAIEQHRDVITRATCYAELLISRRYDRVEIDVLAGASAGGLNAVLYGVAQRVGASTDQILETWQQSGDVWKLLREPQAGSIDSILRGDDYFWDEVNDALAKLHSTAPSHEELVSRVSVDLSATIIDGEASLERGIREGKGHFHFSGGTETDLEGRRIPRRGDEGWERAIERLAYAARTTSSFPGAFEPALIYSGEEAAPSGVVDMRHAFHAHRQPRHSKNGRVVDPFRVVDGSVTDNVPIDRTLRAIRDRSADRYVNRAMIYLDPSPELQFAGLVRPVAYEGDPPKRAREGEPSTRRKDERSTFVGVVLTAIGHMLGRESKDDEVEAVEQFRRTLFIEQAKDELFGPITEQPILREGNGLPEHVSRAYARFRSGTDFDLLMRVLVEPSLWQLTTDEPTASHVAFTREDLRLLETHFIGQVGSATSRARLDGICTGSQALVDACRCLLAWLRSIEDGAFWHDDIYTLDDLDRVVWPKAGVTVAPSSRLDRGALRTALHDALNRAVRRRDAGLRCLLEVTDTLSRAGDVDPRRLARAATSAWLRYANTAEPAESWDELKPLMDFLRAVSHAMDEWVGNPPTIVPDQRDYDRSSDWARSPWSGIGRTSAGFGPRDLAPLVAARGMPMVMPAMKYEDITAAECVVQPRAFDTLMQAQMVDGYRSLMKLHLPDARKLAMTGGHSRGEKRVSESVRRLMPDDHLRPRIKLAGMGLFSFAGFLSRAWRANDWWWGRVDAAHGIIDVLESFGAFPPHPVEDPHSLALKRRLRAENAVLDQWRAARDTTTKADRASFRASIGSDTGGVAALDPSYRLAVASRLLRLASQAITRGVGPLSPRRVAQWILRPLFVFVPLTVTPARFALVAAILAAPFIAFAVPRPLSFGAAVTGGILVVATASVLGETLVERLLRHSALHRALDGERRMYLKQPLRRAAWDGGVAAALAVLLVAVTVTLSLLSWQTGPGTWVLLLTALTLALLANRRFLVPTMRSRRNPLRIVAAIAAALAVVATAWLLHLREWVSVGQDSENWYAIIAAAIGAILAWVLTYGWLFGFASGPKALPFLQFAAIGAAAALAAAVPWLVPPFGSGERISWVYPAVVSLWLWGTVVWWLPAIWRSAYTPNDEPALR